MSPDEPTFIQAMGGRIAAAPKEADLTQVCVQPRTDE
jgi:hypothetical protein